MGLMGWAIRRGVWERIVAFKFSTNQNLDVTRLKKDPAVLDTVPISQIYPAITIRGVFIGERTPADERYPAFRYRMRRFFSKLFMWLNRVFPPAVSGLPMIDANPQAAIASAYTERHRRAVIKAAEKHGKSPKEVLEAPVLPLDFEGTGDLGALAVRGPFAGYVKKVATEDLFEWDLRQLGEYRTRPGLFRLGVRVLFRHEPDTRRLVPVSIESVLGTTRPGDPIWPIAKKIALGALSNHTSLIRHWNWVHLIGGEIVSVVTRNAFAEHHPMCRLLWPHIFGTQASNRLCTESQLVPGGDFEAVFSYDHDEMYRLFSDTVAGFDVQEWDPQAFAAKRGLLNAGLSTSTEDNLQALFDVMHRHVLRYLAVYYADDMAVRADRSICRWVDELNRLLPNGVTCSSDNVTIARLAKLAASCIYVASVQHELVGTFLWNYQLWTHVLPVRVLQNGGREPVDVYQRLVNANFMLSTPRAPLIDDLTTLALPDPSNPSRHAAAVKAFADFRSNLEDLQAVMSREPWMPWKIYPKALEININA